MFGKTKHLPLFSFLIVFLTSQVLAIAQHLQGNTSGAEGKYRIGTSNGPFIPDAKIDINLIRSNSFGGKSFALLQFVQIPSDKERNEWAKAGLLLTDYLPGNAYYAVIDNSFPFASVESLLRAAFPLDKRLKMEASLFAKGIPQYALSGNGLARMVISYQAGLSFSGIIEDLKTKGVLVETHRDYARQLDVTFKADDLEMIANLPYVQFLGVQPDKPVNDAEDHNNSTARVNYVNTGFGGLNYNGAGVVLGVGEGGTIDSLKNIKGRFTEFETTTPSSHKIDVINYMAGAGNLDPIDRNNAWGGYILSLSGNPDYTSLYSSHGLRYTNHSYGTSSVVSASYNSDSRSHDLRIASLPKHMVIYSSGNSGNDTGYAPYSAIGWANITGSFKQSKNQFTIGAINSLDVLTGFSSRGPMYDGRIIPQLVIEGGGGTSYAAPKVTGIMGILNQIYKDKTGGTEPPSSLLRAILMNTADDLENPGPDFRTGYGRPNIKRAYHTIDDARYLTSTVSHGSTNSHNITVPSGTKQLRVMIVWPDVAASVGATRAIVNNLNLLAKSPSSVSYNPWVLDHSPSVASISANAVRALDSINTIEQVTVNNPETGTWTLEVKGYNVPMGPQTYYLVYEFLTDELRMAFPLENQRLISGETYKLRWDSYGSTGTFSLDYELNGSGIWTNIVSGYDTASRVFSWFAPNTTGISTVKFRVKRGALTATSGINYIGRIPENFRVYSSCADTVVLKWSPVANADSYKVYRLGAQYMEQVTSGITFTGTSARLTGQSTGTSEYYGVSAVTGTNEGSRTMTLEKPVGDWMCGGVYWTGVISTDWFDPGNWSSGAVPLATDNVIIPAAPTNQPLISGADAVCGRITIESGASLSMSNTTNDTLSVYVDWFNNGTFTRGTGIVEFTGTISYQEIGGSDTTNFNVLRINKGDKDLLVEATALIKLSASANPLNLVGGTFKLSSVSTITPFTNGSGANISFLNGIWNNGGTISTGNFTWLLNGGLIRSSAGTMNIGTNSNNNVSYLNNGEMIIEGGAVNISGRYESNAIGTSTTKYKQTGGILTVNTVGSTSTTRAPFQINPAGTFSMYGGTIVMPRRSSNTDADFINLSSKSIVQGGTIQIGNASTPAGQTIRITSSVPVYNFTVNATNAPTAQLLANGLTVKNNLNILGGTFNTNSLDVNIGGNISNSGTLSGGISVFTANGNDVQNIAGTAPISINNLTLNNPAGIALSGSTDLQINNSLSFLNGKIKTLTNKVIVGDNATVTGNDGTKFIDGNCRKVGDDAFLFPIGSGTVYAPVSISAPAVSTDHFTASYFPVSPDASYSRTSLLAPIVMVNNYEYWILNRTGGTSNVAVTLSWDAARSGFVSAFGDLLVARWDGTQWVSEGNAGTTGGASAGTLASNTVTSFSPFTLATSSSFSLPLDLLSFSATAAKDKVLLQWSIAGERSFFTVERSGNGKTWETVTQLNDNATGLSARNYSATDIAPYKGKSFYRLRLTTDGQKKYSNIETVVIDNKSETELLLYPNPTNGTLYILTSEKEYDLEIINTQGVSVFTAHNAETLDVSGIQTGNYFVRFTFANNRVVTKALSIQK